MSIRPLLLKLIQLPNPTLIDLDRELKELGFELQLSEIGVKGIILDTIKTSGIVAAVLRYKKITGCEPDQAAKYVENLVREFNL